jgi:large subunit ribosomal protein L17
MRHQHGVAKLGKTPSHRRAMLRNMVTSLLRHERIATTAPKAKEAKRWAERMITLGKRGDLHARRQAATFVNDETVLKKLFDEIAPAFKERQGGYTRIMRTGVRKGDVAEMTILELVTKSPGRKKPANRKTRERLAKFEPGKRETAAGRAKKKPKKAARTKAAAAAGEEAATSPE